MPHITGRHLLTIHDTLALEYFFSTHKKNKIDAKRENQCATRWLLNDFLFHGMFEILVVALHIMNGIR